MDLVASLVPVVSNKNSSNLLKWRLKQLPGPELARDSVGYFARDPTVKGSSPGFRGRLMYVVLGGWIVRSWCR